MKKIAWEGVSQLRELLELAPYLKSWNTYVDILIIALVIYKVMDLIKETRAEQLIKGIAMLIIATRVSEMLGLHTVYWLLKNLMTVGFVAVVVIFQPELRRALEHLGRGRFFSKGDLQDQELEIMLEEMSKSVAQLSKNKIGALIILEQDTGLNEYIETGTEIDSKMSAELVSNIFVPNTPLHDGAVVVRKNRIAAAGCFLPLTQNQNLSKELGTRHRAALGITEISDALAIVVSEETGVISFAMEGKLSRYLDIKSLKEIIKNNYKIKEEKQPIWMKWGGKNE